MANYGRAAAVSRGLRLLRKTAVHSGAGQWRAPDYQAAHQTVKCGRISKHVPRGAVAMLRHLKMGTIKSNACRTFFLLSDSRPDSCARIYISAYDTRVFMSYISINWPVLTSEFVSDRTNHRNCSITSTTTLTATIF